MPEVVELTEPMLNSQEVRALSGLAKSIGRKDTFAELGTWTGQSASVIGLQAKTCGGHLYCIDHWHGSEATHLVQIAQQTDVFGVFRHNMEVLQIWDCITPISKDSLIASKEFANQSIDFLFMDADHRYQPFIQDLSVWFPKVKSGGMICGHDCEGRYSAYTEIIQWCLDNKMDMDFTGKYHAGVIRALHDFFNDEYWLIPDTRLWFKWVA